MSKAVLISIRPRWCQKIANGEKTIEVRKTRPKLQPPFRCYIYCTQNADMLWISKESEREFHPDKIADIFKAAGCGGAYRGNGKIVGEFICDRIYELAPLNHAPDDVEQQACMTREGIVKYLKGTGYGWHISDLKIYDTPRELGEFWFPPELYCEKERCGGCPYDQVADVNGEYSYDCEWRRPLSRPPQSWHYVEEIP